MKTDSFDERLPIERMRRSEMLRVCNDRGIKYPPGATAGELRQLLSGVTAREMAVATRSAPVLSLDVDELEVERTKQEAIQEIMSFKHFQFIAFANKHGENLDKHGEISKDVKLEIARRIVERF